MTSRRPSISSRFGGHVSFGYVLSNWTALVALWALPYLTLLDYLHIDAGQSRPLQWSLVAIGASGIASLLFVAWRQSRDPAWRAGRGLSPRQR